MKSIATFFLFAATLCAFQTHVYGQETQRSIQWNTNFEKAVAEAKTSNKPLLLLFTGTGWCPFCVRLDKEVFTTSEFANAAGKEFVFVKLDFPKGGTQDPRLQAQNDQLAQRFQVRAYPTVVVIDANQKLIGTTGYRPGGAAPYAAHLLKMIKEYTSYKQQMQTVGTQKLSGGQLKHLLDKARSLALYGDESELVRAGMDSDQKSYFQIERYRMLSKEGALQAPEALSLKKELLQKDPPELQHNAYDIALIEFETLSEQMDVEEISPEVVVEPLVSYLEKFGGEDKQNTWRLQMMIFQVYLDHNKVAQALRYAQSSYDAAPATVQPEIAAAIRNLSAELEN